MVCLDHRLDDALVAASIPARADRRAMGPQFQAGAAAAWLACQAAGIVSEEQRRGVSMYVATRPGERDAEFDAKLFADPPGGEAELNLLLMSNLRPTLFLSQLPNLLAGNLAIVMGFAGASRTFMGEEMAGVHAISTATRDVARGRRDVALVGGALNARREDLLRWLYAGGHGASTPARPVAEDHGRGVLLGSLASFLIVESAAAAGERGAVVLRNLGTWRAADAAGLVEAVALAYAAARRLVPQGRLLVITNAQGGSGSAAELQAWRQTGVGPQELRLSADQTGSGLEVDAAAQVVLGTGLIADQGEETDAVLCFTSGLASGAGAFLLCRR